MSSALSVPLTGRRLSAADREEAVEILRGACADERLSLDTFSARLTLVYGARTRFELDRALSDVVPRSLLRRAVIAFVAWASRWSNDLAAAWRGPRTARLSLPSRPEVIIGRGRLSDVVVADDAVSIRHAFLRFADGQWTLADAGSTNGTYVNGCRITDPVIVRAGDEVMFGYTRFILALPAA